MLLIRERIHKYFRDPLLDRMDDAAVMDKMVFTTDPFVVNPLSFPGGISGNWRLVGLSMI
jgi:hydrogenase maturation factor